MSDYLLGIDISGYDGIWNPSKSKQRGIDVATIRSSWGLTGIDSKYQTNWDNAAAVGISRMAYHWYKPRYDPIAQALHFVTHSAEGEYPRMLDLEDYGATKGYIGVADEIKRFLDEVERLTGERCSIYTNVAYSAYFRRPRDNWLADYPLVVASWNQTAPVTPWPWYPMMWLGWQFTGSAHGPSYGTEGASASLYVFDIL